MKYPRREHDMITKKAFEAAARETLAYLEKITYERVIDEMSDIVYVNIDNMFENVEEGLDDDDLDALDAHATSVWAAVASRVHAIDPDWTPNYAEEAFTNPYAFEDARDRFYSERESWYEFMRESESFYRTECCGARW